MSKKNKKITGNKVEISFKDKELLEYLKSFGEIASRNNLDGFDLAEFSKMIGYVEEAMYGRYVQTSIGVGNYEHLNLGFYINNTMRYYLKVPCVSDIAKQIINIYDRSKDYSSIFREQIIRDLRKNIRRDSYINYKTRCVNRPHGIDVSILDDIKTYHAVNSFEYYYYAPMMLSHDKYFHNYYKPLYPCIRNSEKIYAFMDGTIYNNKIEKIQNPIFEYENSDYFTDQQKLSIENMEELEIDNALNLYHFDNKSINKIIIKTNFGILTNNPGTGKTRVAAAFALRNAVRARPVEFKYEPNLVMYAENLEYESDCGNYEEYSRIDSYKEIETSSDWIRYESEIAADLSKVEFGMEPATLIVVPSSTYGQWIQEFNDLLEEFNIDKKNVLFCIKEKKKKVDVVIPEGFKIILTTSGFYANHLCLYNEPILFNRIMFDEPDTVKYPIGNGNLQCRFKWLISATVKNKLITCMHPTKGNRERSIYIGNNEISGITTTDDAIKYYIFKKITVFNKNDPVDNSKRLKFIEYRNFKDTMVIDKIKDNLNAINPALAEALAAGDEVAINNILGTNEDNICKMDRIYKRLLNNLESAEALSELNRDRWKRINNATEELESLDKKVKEIIDHKSTHCIICHDDLDLEEVIMYDCCLTLVDKSCAGEIVSDKNAHNKCSVCRASPTKMFVFKDTICYKRIKGIEIEPSKVKKVCEKRFNKKYLTVRNDIFDCIFKRENKKVLLYATSTEKTGVVPFIKSLGYEEGVHFNILKGRTEGRAGIMKSYREGVVPILVLLEHKNTAGINLTETDELIVWNRIPNDILKQVVGRVDRLGLDHNVNVHLLDKFEGNLEAVREKYGTSEIKIIDIDDNIEISGI